MASTSLSYALRRRLLTPRINLSRRRPLQYNNNRLLSSYRNNNQQQQLQPTSIFLADWLDQISWHAKVPKGFENFFPKNDNGDNGKKDTDSSTTDKSKSSTSTKKKEDGFTGFKSKNNSKKNNNKQSNNNSGEEPPPENQGIGSLAFFLLCILAARQILDDETSGNGREVTWTDFRNYMLEPGDVDRIVVVNKKFARVYLKPGSRGVPPPTSSMNTGGTLTGINTSISTNMSNTALGSIHSSSSSSSSDEWNDGTTLDLGSTTTEDYSSSQSSTTPITTPSMLQRSSLHNQQHNHQHQQQLTYHFYIGSIDSFEDKLASTQNDLGIHPRDYVPVQYVNETNWTLELLKMGPSLIMAGAVIWFLRGAMGAQGGMGGFPGIGGSGKGGAGGGPGGIFSIGKSNAKKINKEDISVTFADVAGCQEAKKEIMEFVDFLQDSSRFEKLGAKIPKGALLCGPPGTGKTLLAKAVAGEANVPFFSISGSDFIEMFVGVGPSRVRDLFKEARSNAPCIIFIDEIDAVGRQRGRGGFSGGNDERENTLNQLLVEMDGFTSTTGIVVLAGTNRVDILDQALTRPGRFDRQITVDKPDLQGRKEIFQVHLQGITLEGTVDDYAGRLAGLTPGFAGADIANICNEAAIVAARRKADAVSIDDFEKATDRIIGGLESTKIMSKEERSIVAHHEAGHAIAGWFLEHADPLLKVTIIPRTSGALGYAQYLPKEVFLRTQEQIMDIVCMALAGRAAEEVFFGRVTTGASDDLRRVTDLVYSTIQIYGMNDKVGQLAFPKDPNAMPGADKPYSDATAEAMDEEARNIVDAAYERTLNLIREKKDEVEKVAMTLLDKETITHDDIVDLIGERPFEGDPAYKDYIRRNDNNTEDTKEEEKVNEDDSSKDEEEEAAGGSSNSGDGLTPGFAIKSI